MTELEEVPIYVGTLNRSQSLKGFDNTEGEPVFEFKDRYLVYMQSSTPMRERVFENGGYVDKVYKYKVCVPYYKKTLSPFINYETK